LRQTVLDAGLGSGSTHFAVFKQCIFISRNVDQNMPKNSLFFWKKAVEPNPIDFRQLWAPHLCFTYQILHTLSVHDSSTNMRFITVKKSKSNNSKCSFASSTFANFSLQTLEFLLVGKIFFVFGCRISCSNGTYFNK